MTPYDEHLQHLIAMASNPATKAHAWHRAQEMASCESGLWAGIDKDLMAAIQSASPSTSKPSAKPTLATTGAKKPGASARSAGTRT